jgi:A/G-specific adenine glycosylase
MEAWFSSKLIEWYNTNKRDLPWRHEKNPYLIWISEVILQQTQVAQGLAYYQRFVLSFPTVKALAEATEDQVLKLWQGLGYYSRARNMHTSAKIICSDYKGVFPASFEQIKALKGIGDYTAAAIASFAFNQAHAVVDGNVYRVLSRVFGINTPIDSSAAKKQFQLLANTLLNKKQPGQHNQAIMEFGSQYCKPVNPDCESCIFNGKCIAFKDKTVAALPVKAKKIKTKNRYLNYVVIIDKHKKLLVNRRGENDIWQGLYEFSLVETPSAATREEILNSEQIHQFFKKGFDLLFTSKPYKHLLTHQLLYAQFYVIKIPMALPDNAKSVAINNLNEVAFSRLTEKFLDDCVLKDLY